MSHICDTIKSSKHASRLNLPWGGGGGGGRDIVFLCSENTALIQIDILAYSIPEINYRKS